MARKEDNLIPGAHPLTVDEASRGGKASGEARRQKRDLRRALETLLEKDYQQKDKDGHITGTVAGSEALAAKLFEQAMKGNVRAFETLRDTVGQKPIEKVMLAEVSPEIIDEVEREVTDDEEAGD